MGTGTYTTPSTHLGHCHVPPEGNPRHSLFRYLAPRSPMRIPKPSLTLLILIALLLHPAPLAHSVNMTIDVMTWAKSIKRRAERALHWATYAKTFFEVIKTYQIMRHEGQHILGVITALYDYNNSISLAPELTLTLTSSTIDPYLRFNDVNRR